MIKYEAEMVLDQLKIPHKGIDVDNLACGRITSHVLEAVLRENSIIIDFDKVIPLAEGLNDALRAGRTLRPY